MDLGGVQIQISQVIVGAFDEESNNVDPSPYAHIAPTDVIHVVCLPRYSPLFHFLVLVKKKKKQKITVMSDTPSGKKKIIVRDE